ncbi:EAL domain-containing protein [uncultured Lamprocystis sp.]|jgi:diguanylate cyclase (GGDEF)-like protein/PAS domain S-box-containing protein|uniref:putative bifunctional diguanylate cyclase/phosphodiesterase n=1 Tax=uncultured Lamprocystis sp. TaxID=543132 RepID=UPI0025D8A189|nr:EAL domain-containing protein [uncultured Lamprocystis sp.]
MPIISSNVVYLRPRAWSSSGSTQTLSPATRLGGSVAMAVAGQRALARWSAPGPHEDPDDLREGSRYRDLFERSPTCLLVMDQAAVIQRANATATALLNEAPTELAGTSLFDRCVPSSRPTLQGHLERLAAEGAFDSCEIDLALGADIQLPMCLVTLNLGDTPEGPLRSALFDVSGLRELESGLALAASVVEHTSQGVIVTDADHRTIAVNPAFTTISGYAASEVLGTVPTVFRTDTANAHLARQVIRTLRDQGHWQGEVWNRRKGGDAYLEWVSVNEIRDDEGSPIRYVCIGSDMTSQENAKRELIRLAHYDDLNDLPNRPNLLAQLNRALVEGKHEKYLVGVLFLDLDGFKNVNDSFGHQVGDRLLRFVAEQLKSAVRATDLVARLSGDEFAILIPALKSEHLAGQIAEKVLRQLSQTPFHDNGRELYVGASIGIAVFPKDATNAEELLCCADQAMYTAKNAGGIAYRFCGKSTDGWTWNGNPMESQLRRALERQELGLHYQPRVSVRNFHIRSCEAVLYWERDYLDKVAPEAFIPAAEKSGLIVPLEHWALQSVATQTRLWTLPNRPPPRISIHLSSIHLQPVHVERLLQHLAASVSAGGNPFEVLVDTAAISDCNDRTIAALNRIHGLGIRIALDRFGAGPTPLRQIKSLPISRVRLDPALVRDLETDPEVTSFVGAMIALAHSFRIKVVAGGVVTPTQLKLLRTHRCDEAQGALFSPPIPPDAYIELIEQASQCEPDARHTDRAVSERRTPGLIRTLSGGWSRVVSGILGADINEKKS